MKRYNPFLRKLDSPEFDDLWRGALGDIVNGDATVRAVVIAQLELSAPNREEFWLAIAAAIPADQDLPPRLEEIIDYINQ